MHYFIAFVHLFKRCCSSFLPPLSFSQCPQLVIAISVGIAAGNSQLTLLSILLALWFRMLMMLHKLFYPNSSLMIQERPQ